MKIYISLVCIVFLAFESIGQCFPDRHSTSWYDAWISCEKASNPTGKYGDTHWIMYDLSESYELGEAQFWNYNDPSFLDRGIRKAMIDISIDGQNWYELDTLYLTEAPGASIYEGETAFDFDEEIARFVVITVLETYGDGECAGLGEIRVERNEVNTTSTDIELAGNDCFNGQVFPNPFVDNAVLQVTSKCNEEISFVVVNTLGQHIQSGVIQPGSGVVSLELNDWNLPSGQLTLQLMQGDHLQLLSLTRLDR